MFWKKQKTVDTIVAPLTKIVDELTAHEAARHNAAVAKTEEAARLMSAAEEERAERLRAAEASSRIKALLS